MRRAAQRAQRDGQRGPERGKGREWCRASTHAELYDRAVRRSHVGEHGVSTAQIVAYAARFTAGYQGALVFRLFDVHPREVTGRLRIKGDTHHRPASTVECV